MSFVEYKSKGNTNYCFNKHTTYNKTLKITNNLFDNIFISCLYFQSKVNPFGTESVCGFDITKVENVSELKIHIEKPTFNQN